MNKYIKPEFMLTSLTGTNLSAGNCSFIIDKDEQAGLDEDFGPGAFFEDAVCKNPVDGYCKFSLGDSGELTKAFSS